MDVGNLSPTMKGLRTACFWMIRYSLLSKILKKNKKSVKKTQLFSKNTNFYQNSKFFSDKSLFLANRASKVGFRAVESKIIKFWRNKIFDHDPLWKIHIRKKKTAWVLLCFTPSKMCLKLRFKPVGGELDTVIWQ